MTARTLPLPLRPTPTHAELVAVATRWLRKTIGCTVVLTEFTSSEPETPDAIGWKIGPGWSWVVECKTSRADFRADLKKPHRIVGGLGQERYYLTAPGLLRPEELPEGWGLLEWDGRRVQVAVKHPKAPDRGNITDNRRVDPEVSARELRLALSALRRHWCKRCFASIAGNYGTGSVADHEVADSGASRRPGE